MKTHHLSTFLLITLPLLLSGQPDTAHLEVDTSSAGYKIGYQIGSWLPFIVLAGILIFLTMRAVRKGKDTPA